GRTSWSSTGSRTDSARRSGGVSSWLADVRIVTPCPRGGRGPVTRVVLGVGPVLVSTVVPFWVDIHSRPDRGRQAQLQLVAGPPQRAKEQESEQIADHQNHLLHFVHLLERPAGTRAHASPARARRGCLLCEAP